MASGYVASFKASGLFSAGSQEDTGRRLRRAEKYIVIAGNFNDESKTIAVKLGERYLNVALQPHSFNTFQLK